MTSQILDYSDEDFRQLANKIIEDGSVVLRRTKPNTRTTRRSM